MPNIKTIISSHNQQIINPTNNKENQKLCNCQIKENCPMNNECMTTNIIYEATLTSPNKNNTTKKYVGLCETNFKNDTQITSNP